MHRSFSSAGIQSCHVARDLDIVGIAEVRGPVPSFLHLAALQAASNLAVMELKRTIEALPLEKPVAPAIAAKLALLDVNEFNLLLRELAREQQAYRCISVTSFLPVKVFSSGCWPVSVGGLG